MLANTAAYMRETAALAGTPKSSALSGMAGAWRTDV